MPEFLMFSYDFAFSSEAKSQAKVVASVKESSTAFSKSTGILSQNDLFTKLHSQDDHVQILRSIFVLLGIFVYRSC